MASQKTPESNPDDENTKARKRDPTTVPHSESNTNKVKKPRITTTSFEEVELSLPSTRVIAQTPSRGWYGGGSWPKIQKSNPSIQVVKESILASKSGNNTTPADLALFEHRKPPEAISLNTDPSSPQLSMDPGNGGLTPELVSGKVPTSNNTGRGSSDTTKNEAMMHCVNYTNDRSADTINGLQTLVDGSNLESNDVTGQRSTSGWLEWLRPTKSKQDLARTEEVARSINEPRPPDEISCDIPAGVKELQYPSTSTLVPHLQQRDKIAQQKSTKPTSLWPGIWPASSASKTTLPQETIDEPETIQSDSGIDNSEQCSNTKRSGSSWAFWSRQAPNATQETTLLDEPGELAVTGEPSQDHTVTAHSNGPANSKTETGKQRSRLNPSPEILDKKLSSAEFSTKPVETTGFSALKTYAPNLLLPSFRNTYQLVESPSIIQQISRLLFRGRQSQTNHLYLINDPPKIRKAIAIGIHGLFPAALLRTVIGQPTGTSIRFANHGAAAIDRWARKYSVHCDIEKIALEGEGKIAERVDHLWKLLLNWIEHVRQADFILVACHSQGVPVAIMLTAKLISLGVVNSVRIGICAMAGVSLGPFPDYRSRFFSGSAAELFEFANLDSEVSRSYHEALSVALKYGVRVTYVGSIDDQLVSLESAVFSPVDHPYIYRSVFVDGRIHAPDFITNLVGFALKLRNLGVSDHQLIKALSTPLAGSLYSGEGHSRLYDEKSVYDLCVQFALETTSVDQDVALKVRRSEASSNSNPFQLPWSMRGLLEEDVVKTELNQEAKELLLQFEEWKPSSKVLKDVKYRLEVVKSKL